MLRWTMLEKAALWTMVLTISACYAPIPPETRTPAKETDSIFTGVLNDPASYVGSVVVWGGRIVKTTYSDRGTEILIMEIPVDDRGFPESGKDSDGWFVARTAKFLDPDTYTEGKWLTVEGKITGQEKSADGIKQSFYPVVEIKGHHLWGGGSQPAGRDEAPPLWYDPYGRPESGWPGPENEIPPGGEPPETLY